MASNNNIVVSSTTSTTPCVYFPTNQNNPLWVNWTSLLELLQVQNQQKPSGKQPQQTANSLQQNWFLRICTHYSELHRRYHNLSHISELVQYYEEYKQKINDRASVGLAIWFHDVIYDPKRNDNEEKSAELFHEFGNELKLPQEIITKVGEYILATKTHKVSGQDEDLLMFLDMDMAVLGKSPEEYQQYSANIRKEYSHYPEDDYRKGRVAVLRQLLGGDSQSSIYLTQVFRSKYEDNARRNMQQEIESLSSVPQH